MQMKALLVKCPRYYISHFEENSESLALAYLAASLRGNGFEVKILDASLMGLSIKETVDRVMLDQYDLIGFTIADLTFIKSTFEVIKLLREKGAKSHITIGGHAPTFQYKEVLEMCRGLDSVVMHEGEGTIVELASALAEGKGWRRLEGIAYRDGHNGIKANLPRPLISNLDDLPFPARDMLPFLLEHKKETGVVSMAGSRGCYANCGFCSIRAFYTIPKGNPWRIRSNENIVDEMEYLVSTFGVKEILFVDDVFIGLGKRNIERVYNLADEIEKRDLKVMLSISERVDNIKEDIFTRLREVGLRQILLGIESGSQDILDYFDKNITLNQIRQAISTLENLNIDTTVSFINFTPMTTLENLRRNLDFFTSLRANILQGLLNRFQIYYGTPLAEKLESQGLIEGKFPHYTYKAVDDRVDLVYNIVQKSLGTFLSIAYELKKVERALRLRLFEAEVSEAVDVLKVLRKGRGQYREMMIKIMQEAAAIFREIIEFAESRDVQSNEKVDEFTDKIVQIARDAYRNWMRLIVFFKDFSPAFKMFDIQRASTLLERG